MDKQTKDIVEYYSYQIKRWQNKYIGAIETIEKDQDKISELTFKLKEMEDKKNFWHKQFEYELAHAQHAEERIEELEKENKRLAEYEYMYKELCK